MSATQGIKVVFGGGSISKARFYNDAEAVNTLLDILSSNDVRNIDTAQLYGESEELLGEVGAGQRFIIDTKAKGGFAPGSGTEENIVNHGLESLKRLKVNKVDIFYLHAPDPSVPISSTLAGINTLHKHGAFSRFGLSNYKAEDVQKVYNHCKERDYILPTAYQGNYSPVARLQEKLLFPTLRKLGISFYSYSPLAGGFLTKTKQQVLDGAGRFNGEGVGKLYRDLYAKPALLEALAEWERVAKEAGCEKAELAYRWVRFNSSLKFEYGDAIIVGARSFAQAEQTLKWLEKGSLPEGALKGIDEVWKSIEHEAPLDNYNM